MAEKFRKIVNAPAKAFGNARNNIQKKKPTSKTGKVAKVTGIGVTGLMQFLLWATKYAALDNHFLRKAEELLGEMNVNKNKKGNYKKVSSFMKKYPNFSAHMLYYMMFVMVIGGGKIANDKGMFGKFINKEQKATEEDEPITLDASDKDFVKKAIVEYWPEMANGLTELETYRETPKLHRGESRETNGLGVTWNYTRNDKGILIQKANDKNTPVYDRDANYKQAKMHLEKETVLMLKKAIVGKNSIDRKGAIGLVYAGFQRPADMATIATNVNKAKTPQEIADAFQYTGKMSSKWREGTLKRRWICGAYAAGIISDKDISNMYRDAFSKVDINNIYRNGKFLLDKETVKYMLSRTSSNETVKEFLSEFKVGREILSGLKTAKKDTVFEFEDTNRVISKIEKSMGLLNQADSLYKKGNYDKSVDLFEKAIKEDADNMEAYSSLALAYKKLGDKNKSINSYQKSLDVVVACNKRMNANKDLLFDHSVKAASYYNAGLARQAMAEIYKDKKNPEEAKINYILAKKNFENALYNIEQLEDAEISTDVYKNAINKIDKILKDLEKEKASKKTAFKAAGRNIDKKSLKQNVMFAQQKLSNGFNGGRA